MREDCKRFGDFDILGVRRSFFMRKAYGFRNVKTLPIALYHALGNLPEPKINHKFY